MEKELILRLHIISFGFQFNNIEESIKINQKQKDGWKYLQYIPQERSVC